MKLAVSACLLGVLCKYDGTTNTLDKLSELVKKHDIIPVCPEQLGGLSTPRPPCEQQADGRVLSIDGDDKTKEFTLGAKEALKICRLFNVDAALLKARSPSCGFGRVYDGSFSKTLIDGDGVFAGMLKAEGFKLYNEYDIDMLIK